MKSEHKAAIQQHTPRVLVVDDEQRVRFVLSEALERIDCVVEQAESGAEAISAFERFQPDIVLLDIMMPEMNGIVTCARLQALPGGDRVPVLMITALYDEESVRQAFDAGATDYVTKPVHLPVLRQRVRRMLRTRQAEEGQRRALAEALQATRALRESERKYRTLFEESRDAIYIATQEGAFIDVNQSALELFGYVKEEMLNLNLREIYAHPADLDRFQRAIEAAGSVREFEATLCKQDGTEMDCLITSTVRRTSDGSTLGSQGIIRDVTELKQAEKVLKESQKVLKESQKVLRKSLEQIERAKQEWEATVDSLPQLVCLLDKQKRILRVNRTVERWEIAQVTDVKNREVHEFFHPGCTDPACHLNIFWHQAWESLNRGQSAECEIEDRILNRHLYIQVRPLLLQGDEGDETTASFAAIIIQDITERKRVQAMMLESQKLADLGTLAAGVAHEINSPLQVITGVSQSLINRLDKGLWNNDSLDHLRRQLGMIHRNGSRCARIARSLRIYAHASTGQSERNDLNVLVHDTLLLIEHQLKNWSNITVVTDLAADLPALQCDRNQISQVLINLLTNAQDAMPEGGEVTIRTSYDSTRQRIILQVTDTGAGIPEPIQTKIFDPFFTTKPVGEGTGLGLSIVSGIVRAHGGEIDVSSAPGQGTTFTLSFPENANGVHQDNQAALASPSAVRGRFDIKNRR